MPWACEFYRIEEALNESWHFENRGNRGNGSDLADESCPAQTLNWDPNITGGSAQGGTGTWNNSNVNWAVLSTSTDQTWTSGDTAVFDGAIAGAVSLTKSESANNLVFNTSGYTISGNNQLTLSGGSVSVVPGGSATISSPLGLTPGANWYSTGGTLTLGGVSSQHKFHSKHPVGHS